jgi:hypothetical protein
VTAARVLIIARITASDTFAAFNVLRSETLVSKVRVLRSMDLVDDHVFGKSQRHEVDHVLIGQPGRWLLRLAEEADQEKMRRSNTKLFVSLLSRSSDSSNASLFHRVS